MFLNFEFEKEEYRFHNIEKIELWLKQTVSKENKKIGEIEYHFVSEEEILRVNREFLNHDYYTDIITFDESFINIINGSIFISPETVLYNSQILEKSYNEELNRVIVHGIMHLCGYKDATAEEKELMRKLEEKYLGYLEKL